MNLNFGENSNYGELFNLNFHLIWRKTLLTNDFKLTMPDLYTDLIDQIDLLKGGYWCCKEICVAQLILKKKHLPGRFGQSAIISFSKLKSSDEEHILKDL